MPEQPTSPNQNSAPDTDPQKPASAPAASGQFVDESEMRQELPHNQAPEEQPDQEAAPHNLQTPANTVAQQPFANDFNHDENELQGPSRGEFGRQSGQGYTQGGYGNERSRGPESYAGALNTPAATTGYDGEREQKPAGFVEPMGSRYGSELPSSETQKPSSVSSGFANDNAAPKGPDSGYSENYGTSSLGGAGASSAEAQPEAHHRNQREDYTPGHPEGGPGGLHTGLGASGPATGEQEAGTSETQGNRSGYNATGNSAQGSEQKGFGTKGGSYNDEYDSANDAAQAGSPSRGDYDKQDAAQNYGGAASDRTDNPDSPDYGAAPRRAESHTGGEDRPE
ncbi:hypothetical protein SAMN06265337_2779 [Hymenobacter gelipurpurascens]|uniref:Uncharacterized protein n=1 Tax=Hymenobacter gelipurpurascens TaxID=89968 RepID=A0A212UAD1_9BACT|nr:hypothetical protein [Hymenobacter gelipurpurascens]SNC75248.1 hypothetical protein SAMN06265337_2779 [Hymenobacter gelipurpurascens]